MQSENQEKLVLEAYRRTENRLTAQAEFAIASDQRALVLATVSAALAAVVAALNSDHGSNFWAIGGTFFLSCSSVLAIISALPQGMKTSGSKYSELSEKISENRDFVNVIAGLALNNDDYIDQNEQKASTRAHFYRFAVVLCAIGVLLALIPMNYAFVETATSSKETMP